MGVAGRYRAPVREQKIDIGPTLRRVARLMPRLGGHPDAPDERRDGWIGKARAGDVLEPDAAMHDHRGDREGQAVLRLRGRVRHGREELDGIIEAADADLGNLLGSQLVLKA